MNKSYTALMLLALGLIFIGCSKKSDFAQYLEGFEKKAQDTIPAKFIADFLKKVDQNAWDIRYNEILFKNDKIVAVIFSYAEIGSENCGGLYIYKLDDGSELGYEVPISFFHHTQLGDNQISYKPTIVNSAEVAFYVDITNETQSIDWLNGYGEKGAKETTTVTTTRMNVSPEGGISKEKPISTTKTQDYE